MVSSLYTERVVVFYLGHFYIILAFSTMFKSFHNVCTPSCNIHMHPSKHGHIDLILGLGLPKKNSLTTSDTGGL